MKKSKNNSNYFSYQTASSSKNDQKIAFSELKSSGDEQCRVDEQKYGDEDQINRVILDVGFRKLMGQVDLMFLPATFLLCGNQPPIDADVKRLSEVYLIK